MQTKGRLRAVKVVTPLAPLVGPQGAPGVRGVGVQGARGLQGLTGAPGAVPEHRWVGEDIQFQNPDGSWGSKRNLRGPQGFVGGGTVGQLQKYYVVDTATYIINKTEPGLNIYGVRFAGAVTITLPESIPHDRTIIINDETGNADANNITVQTLA